MQHNVKGVHHVLYFMNEKSWLLLFSSQGRGGIERGVLNIMSRHKWGTFMKYIMGDQMVMFYKLSSSLSCSLHSIQFSSREEKQLLINFQWMNKHNRVTITTNNNESVCCYCFDSQEEEKHWVRESILWIMNKSYCMIIISILIFFWKSFPLEFTSISIHFIELMEFWIWLTSMLIYYDHDKPKPALFLLSTHCVCECLSHAWMEQVQISSVAAAVTAEIIETLKLL